MSDETKKPSYTPQPLVLRNDVVRFRCNEIVRYLLDAGSFDLNILSKMQFDREDFEQFAQLIGYSVSSYSELDYVSDESSEASVALAESMVLAETK